MRNGWVRLDVVALALVIPAIVATASLVQPSLAQQWPAHPVRFVLPFGPGSGADTAARLITDSLQQKWGQPIVIDGRPGGDGLLSVGMVVSAKDDHTLFFGPSSIFVVQRYLHDNMTFDPQTDLAPIVGAAKVKVAVEAAVRQGWDEIIGSDGAFVGMTSFGASAPAKDLYKHFGITPQNVAEAALAKLGWA